MAAAARRAAQSAFSAGRGRKGASGYVLSIERQTSVCSQSPPGKPELQLEHSQKAAASQGKIEEIKATSKRLVLAPAEPQLHSRALAAPKNRGDRHQNAKYSTV